MSRSRRPLLSRHSFIWMVTGALLLVTFGPRHFSLAQSPGNKLRNAESSSSGSSESVNKSASALYAEKIKEYTTEPYFVTELVDHLPISDQVPSPDKILGYVIGTPNK